MREIVAMSFRENLKIDADMHILKMPQPLFKELTVALNKDSKWEILAGHVAEKINLPCSVNWIENLKQDCSINQTPAERLLFELGMQMCNVEILCHFLDSCQLRDVSSLLRLPEPIVIITQPTRDIKSNILEIPAGESLHLTCEATGIPIPQYSWYCNEKLIKDCTSYKLIHPITSSTETGEYKCKIFQVDSNGSIISSLLSKSVTVKIKSTPVEIIEQPVPYIEVKENSDFKIHVKVKSYSKIKYQWFCDNTKLIDMNSDVLEIKSFTLKNEGKYYCLVSNDISEVFTTPCYVMADLPREKATAKIALLIGNTNYDHLEQLQTSRNDAAKIATLLTEIGFTVISLINLNLNQTRRAIRIFSKVLTEGVYGLFYFAGHGFKMQENHMLAVDAPKMYLRKDTICESELLAELLNGDPTLLVVILDMCQTVPHKEINPAIHEEIPAVNEYKSKKNLRNLIQAYSTSSHRPSYERASNKYGLYVTHLSKYISKDIPVSRVFEEVGKSIDVWLKGTERNQIPMFASTVTKSFRLTDAIHNRDLPLIINEFYKLIAFQTTTLTLDFKQAGIQKEVILKQSTDLFLNVIHIIITDMDDLEINFYNSVPISPNNLFQCANKNECWLNNPQINKGPLVVSLSKDKKVIGAALLDINKYIPLVLNHIGV